MSLVRAFSAGRCYINLTAKNAPSYASLRALGRCLRNRQQPNQLFRVIRVVNAPLGKV